MEQQKSRESAREKLITASVLEFLNKHIKSSQQNTLDEIVLDYVVSVLEILATETGSLKDFFDVAEFCEMLTAYFPEFESIPHEVVSGWIFDLVASLNKQAEQGKPKREPVHFESLLDGFGSIENNEREQLVTTHTNGASNRKRSKRNSESSSEGGSNGGSCSSKSSSSRSPRLSETSDAESEPEAELQSFYPLNDNQCVTLLEMFPNLMLDNVRKALLEADGDLETAADRIMQDLERRESGKPWISTSNTSPPIFMAPNGTATMRSGAKPSAQSETPFGFVRLPGGGLVKKDDVNIEKVMKERIFARYGFIDKEEDKKEFRPPPLKSEPKKMVRYRESQVVSTKGERYSEVRCKDGGEIKPYIHKPNKNN